MYEAANSSRVRLDTLEHACGAFNHGLDGQADRSAVQQVMANPEFGTDWKTIWDSIRREAELGSMGLFKAQVFGFISLIYQSSKYRGVLRV